MNDMTPRLPEMAAKVLPANSTESDLMRFGKEQKRAEKKRIDGPDLKKQTLVASTAIYDGLAVLYNEAEVHAMLVVALPNRPTMGNLNRILKGRGLTQGVDYLAYRAKFDVDGNKYPVKDRPLVIERLTDVLMKVSNGKGSYGREMATLARERGEVVHELTHARQLGPKGRRGELAEERIKEALAEGDLLDQVEVDQPILPASSPAGYEQDEMDRLARMELPPLQVGG